MTQEGPGPVTAGEYIKRLREGRGMSIADLQRALGVAWSTVNSWEKKGAVPDRVTTALIAEKLQLTREERQGLIEAVSYVPPPAPTISPTSPRAPSTPTPRTPSSAPVRDGTPDQRREAMSDALTKALDTQRHTVMDAIFILDALAEGGEAFLTLADPSLAARAWLDAAAVLRSRGLPVTAASLAVVLPEVIADRNGPGVHER